MKQFFNRADAVSAVQVTADTEQVQYHGTWQTVERGTWIIRSLTGEVMFVSDAGFKAQFVEVDL